MTCLAFHVDPIEPATSALERNTVQDFFDPILIIFITINLNLHQSVRKCHFLSCEKKIVQKMTD